MILRRIGQIVKNVLACVPSSYTIVLCDCVVPWAESGNPLFSALIYLRCNRSLALEHVSATVKYVGAN